MERRREWDEHVTRMYIERLVKISIHLAGKDLQDALKEDGATSSLIKTSGIAYNKEEEGGKHVQHLLEELQVTNRRLRCAGD